MAATNHVVGWTDAAKSYIYYVPHIDSLRTHWMFDIPGNLKCFFVILDVWPSNVQPDPGNY